MNIKNYLAYIILLLFTFLMLIIVYITNFLEVREISKETIAKVMPIYVTIDEELLKSLLPANESNLQ